jgi:hypothetical protein
LIYYNIDGTTQWQAIVAINLYLVLDQNMTNKTNNLTGWIAMDSCSDNATERNLGLKNGHGDTLEPENGFISFLNYAATYLNGFHK